MRPTLHSCSVKVSMIASSVNDCMIDPGIVKPKTITTVAACSLSAYIIED